MKHDAKAMVSVLDQEYAVLDKEIKHLQRRQDKIRKLKGLYTGVNILPDELSDAPVQLALTPEEMIQRVKENAGRELTAEEVKELVRIDFGVNLTSWQPRFTRAAPRGESQL